jgi:arylsulfatase A
MKSLYTLMIFIATYTSMAVEKPNIIIIYTDDQGYGDCSLLNPQAKFKTPNIDRIGQEGIVFTDGHCSDTVCSPSRYGLITGRYSWRTYLKSGVIHSDGKPMIANDRATIATMLKRNGYNTAMVGKWHMGMTFSEDGSKILDGPINKGFDYYWGIPASMNYGYCAWYEMDTAKVAPLLYTKKKPNDLAMSDYRISPPYENKDAKGSIKVAEDFEDVKVLENFTHRAIDWINKTSADGKPFFLYLPLTSPHKPVIPQERFRGKSEAGAYGDFVIETDHWIGEIFKALEAKNIYKDTMIIFSSDNGAESTWAQRIKKYDHYSNRELKGGKRDIYEGGHRVPFLISWPNGIARGQVCNSPVNQLDIFATIAELIGDKLLENEAEDSVSFVSFIQKGELAQRLPMLHHSSNGAFAIREGKWKLVFGLTKGDKNEPMALYDMEADISEKTNLIERYPEIVATMTKSAGEIISSGRTRANASTQNDSPVSAWWNK